VHFVSRKNVRLLYGSKVVQFDTDKRSWIGFVFRFNLNFLLPSKCLRITAVPTRFNGFHVTNYDMYRLRHHGFDLTLFMGMVKFEYILIIIMINNMFVEFMEIMFFRESVIRLKIFVSTTMVQYTPILLNQ